MTASTQPQKGKKTPKIKQMDFPNADQGVVTRFPPEPSGYLHVGHAKAALLNDYFAHTRYPGGKLILRFDDTNINKEKEEYQTAIMEDVATLGIQPDHISYTSDFFDQIQQYCIQMIQDGKAYADDTDGDTINAMRRSKLSSRRRDESVEDNLARFELMRTSSEGSGWCIRAKISHASDNASLRDPVIYRCPKDQKPHHRTGTTYKAYPTYQFACPIVDSLEGVTHALRTTEYNDQDAQYKWMLKTLGLRIPFIWTFSKIQFVRTLMSKRNLTKLIDTGIVSGWDDPRFPTIRGILRRGMTVQGLREFMVSQGPSRNVVNMDWHTIWTMNKKVIDLRAGRHTAIVSPLVHCRVVGKGVPPEPTYENRPKHAKYDLGDKKVVFSQNIIIELDDAKNLAKGEEVTLMHWGNVIVQAIDHQNNNTDDAGENQMEISGIDFEASFDGDVKSTKKKLTWLSTDQQMIQVELVDFDHLLTKDKLSKDEAKQDGWEKFLTPQSEFRSFAVADCNLHSVQVNDVLQFDRKRYFRCDRAPSEDASGIFFKIPSGK